MAGSATTRTQAAPGPQVGQRRSRSGLRARPRAHTINVCTRAVTLLQNVTARQGRGLLDYCRTSSIGLRIAKPKDGRTAGSCHGGGRTTRAHAHAHIKERAKRGEKRARRVDEGTGGSEPLAPRPCGRDPMSGATNIIFFCIICLRFSQNNANIPG
jgi:hypothetical protein